MQEILVLERAYVLSKPGDRFSQIIPHMPSVSSESDFDNDVKCVLSVHRHKVPNVLKTINDFVFWTLLDLMADFRFSQENSSGKMNFCPLNTQFHAALARSFRRYHIEDITFRHYAIVR